VREIQEAQSRLAKRAADMQRSESSRSLPGTDDQERLRAELDADRRERELRGPVTQGSVAQALPGGNGANIGGAKDAGFNNGCDC
jgi:hypothetical protein